MAINVNVHGNTRPLEAAVSAAVTRIRRQPIKITVDDKGVTQPLGNMKRSADDFSKSMEAANARIIAFGASMAIINGVADAFKSMVRDVVAVEKALADVNVVMGMSAGNLDKFSAGLFKVAKETGQAFNVATDAATEYARQGLGMEETLKRTRDALLLTRLTGMDSAEAVKALTAAMNTFGGQVKDSTQLVSKFAAVDVKFAVSAEDFAQAISRAGQAAKSAGVELDEFIGMVTSAQQQTARGGAVIGNSLKTIFTRIQKPETLKQLENLGVAVRDLHGHTLPAKRILTELAGTFQTLSDSQKAQTAQTVAGVFQINILKAILADAAKQNSILADSQSISASATDDAIRKNDQLRSTMAALATETGLALKEVSAALGEIMIAPGIEKILNTVKGLAESISGSLGGGEEEGTNWGLGFARGIGNIITGPGMIMAVAVFGKLFFKAFQYAKDSLRSLVGITSEAEKQRAIQSSLVGLFGRSSELSKEMLRTDISRTQKEQIILELLRSQVVEASMLDKVAKSTASTLLKSGWKADLTPKGGRVRAGGHIPSYAASRERKAATKAGYTPGAVKGMSIPGIGPVVYNSAETVKRFPNFAQPAIMPPRESRAGANYQQAFQGVHGFNPYAGAGYIPNFALPNIATSWGKGKTWNPLSSGKVAAGIQNRKAGDEYGFDRSGKPYILTQRDVDSAAKYSGTTTSQIVPGAKVGEIDATKIATMLVPSMSGKQTVSRAIKPGAKSIYGVSTAAMPKIRFNIQGLKRSALKEGAAGSRDDIVQGLRPTIEQVGKAYGDGFNLGTDKSGDGIPAPINLTELWENLYTNKTKAGLSGAKGAIDAAAGSMFEAALNLRLGITKTGASGQRVGSLEVGGDFDARSVGKNEHIRKLFGPTANLVDYKGGVSPETKSSFASKVAKEMVYRQHLLSGKKNLTAAEQKLQGIYGKLGAKAGGSLSEHVETDPQTRKIKKSVRFGAKGYIPSFPGGFIPNIPGEDGESFEGGLKTRNVTLQPGGGSGQMRTHINAIRDAARIQKPYQALNAGHVVGHRVPSILVRAKAMIDRMRAKGEAIPLMQIMGHLNPNYLEKDVADMKGSVRYGATKWGKLAKGSTGSEFYQKGDTRKLDSSLAKLGVKRDKGGFHKDKRRSLASMFPAGFAGGMIPNFAAAPIARVGGLASSKFQMAKLIKGSPFRHQLTRYGHWNNFPPDVKKRFNTWLIKQGGLNQGLKGWGLASAHSGSIAKGITELAAPDGFVPNFAFNPFRRSATQGAPKGIGLQGQGIQHGAGVLKALATQKNATKGGAISGRAKDLLAKAIGAHSRMGLAPRLAADATRSFTTGTAQGLPVTAFMGDMAAMHIPGLWQIGKSLWGKKNPMKEIKAYYDAKLATRGSGAFGGIADGFIPNFADPLSDAIGRERRAGVPVSAIRVGSHRALENRANPKGIGVTNTFDEPRGLKSLFGADGVVPNFAMPNSIAAVMATISTQLTNAFGKIAGYTAQSLTSTKQKMIDDMKIINNGKVATKQQIKDAWVQNQKNNDQNKRFNLKETAEALKQLGYEEKRSVVVLKELGYEEQRATVAARSATGAGVISGGGWGGVGQRASQWMQGGGSSMASRIAGVPGRAIHGAGNMMMGTGGMMMMMGAPMAAGMLEEKGMHSTAGALQGAANWGMMGMMTGNPWIAGAAMFAGAIKGWTDAIKKSREALISESAARYDTQRTEQMEASLGPLSEAGNRGWFAGTRFQGPKDMSDAQRRLAFPTGALSGPRYGPGTIKGAPYISQYEPDAGPGTNASEWIKYWMARQGAAAEEITPPGWIQGPEEQLSPWGVADEGARNTQIIMQNMLKGRVDEFKQMGFQFPKEITGDESKTNWNPLTAFGAKRIHNAAMDFAGTPLEGASQGDFGGVSQKFMAKIFELAQKTDEEIKKEFLNLDLKTVREAQGHLVRAINVWNEELKRAAAGSEEVTEAQASTAGMLSYQIGKGADPKKMVDELQKQFEWEGVSGFSGTFVDAFKAIRDQGWNELAGKPQALALAIDVAKASIETMDPNKSFEFDKKEGGGTDTFNKERFRKSLKKLEGSEWDESERVEWITRYGKAIIGAAKEATEHKDALTASINIQFTQAEIQRRLTKTLLGVGKEFDEMKNGLAVQSAVWGSAMTEVTKAQLKHAQGILQADATYQKAMLSAETAITKKLTELLKGKTGGDLLKNIELTVDPNSPRTAGINKLKAGSFTQADINSLREVGKAGSTAAQSNEFAKWFGGKSLKRQIEFLQIMSEISAQSDDITAALELANKLSDDAVEKNEGIRDATKDRLGLQNKINSALGKEKDIQKDISQIMQKRASERSTAIMQEKLAADMDKLRLQYVAQASGPMTEQKQVELRRAQAEIDLDSTKFKTIESSADKILKLTEEDRTKGMFSKAEAEKYKTMQPNELILEVQKDMRKKISALEVGGGVWGGMRRTAANIPSGEGLNVANTKQGKAAQEKQELAQGNVNWYNRALDSQMGIGKDMQSQLLNKGTIIRPPRDPDVFDPVAKSGTQAAGRQTGFYGNLSLLDQAQFDTLQPARELLDQGWATKGFRERHAAGLSGVDLSRMTPMDFESEFQLKADAAYGEMQEARKYQGLKATPEEFKKWEAARDHFNLMEEDLERVYDLWDQKDQESAEKRISALDTYRDNLNKTLTGSTGLAPAEDELALTEATTDNMELQTAHLLAKAENMSEVLDLMEDESARMEYANSLADKRLHLELKTADARRKRLTGPNAFQEGAKEGMSQIKRESDYFLSDFGQTAVIGFRDGLVSAIGSAMEGAESLGDALEGAALNFADLLADAMLKAAVNKMMMAFLPGLGGMHQGGKVQKFASGGRVHARVSDGEYVMGGSAVKKYGDSFMNNLNKKGEVPRFQAGGAMPSIKENESVQTAQRVQGPHPLVKLHESGGMMGKGLVTKEKVYAPGGVHPKSSAAGGAGLLTTDFHKNAAWRRENMSARFYSGLSGNVMYDGASREAQETLREQLRKKREAERKKREKRAKIMKFAFAVGMFALTGGFSGGASFASGSMGAGLQQTGRLAGASRFGTSLSAGTAMVAHQGGPVRGYAPGGMVKGAPGIDQIPAMLSEGEYVIKSSSVNKLGKSTLDQINAGRFQSGGYVGDEAQGESNSDSTGQTTNNFNISVNVQKGGGGESGGQQKSQVSQAGERYRKEQDLAAKIKSQVISIVQEEQRPGGLLA